MIDFKGEEDGRDFQAEGPTGIGEARTSHSLTPSYGLGLPLGDAAEEATTNTEGDSDLDDKAWTGVYDTEAKVGIVRAMQGECEGLVGILEIPAVEKALQKINRYSMLSGTLKGAIVPGVEGLMKSLTTGVDPDFVGTMEMLSENLETVRVILNTQLLREELERKWMREDLEGTFVKLYQNFEDLEE